MVRGRGFAQQFTKPPPCRVRLEGPVRHRSPPPLAQDRDTTALLILAESFSRPASSRGGARPNKRHATRADPSRPGALWICHDATSSSCPRGPSPAPRSAGSPASARAWPRRSRRRRSSGSRRPRPRRASAPTARSGCAHARPHGRRQDRQHRGRSPQPPQRGHPLPQGRGHLPAPRQPEPPDEGPAPRARRHRVGGVGPRAGDGPRRRAGQEDARRDVRRAARRTASWSTARRPSSRSAAPPSTTSGTTSSRS